MCSNTVTVSAGCHQSSTTTQTHSSGSLPLCRARITTASYRMTTPVCLFCRDIVKWRFEELRSNDGGTTMVRVTDDAGDVERWRVFSSMQATDATRHAPEYKPVHRTTLTCDYERVYADLNTGDWWRDEESKVGAGDNRFLLVIVISSDATHMTATGCQSLHPCYLTGREHSSVVATKTNRMDACRVLPCDTSQQVVQQPSCGHSVPTWRRALGV